MARKNAGMKAIRFTGFNKTETNDTLSDAVVDGLSSTGKLLSLNFQNKRHRGGKNGKRIGHWRYWLYWKSSL